MKDVSVVGRNWWRVIVFALSRRVFAGIERRRVSFSLFGRVRGISRAVRSWLNWGWVSVGCLGWTAGLFDQMQAWRMREFSSGWRRS